MGVARATRRDGDDDDDESVDPRAGHVDASWPRAYCLRICVVCARRGDEGHPRLKYLASARDDDDGDDDDDDDDDGCARASSSPGEAMARERERERAWLASTGVVGVGVVCRRRRGWCSNATGEKKKFVEVKTTHRYRYPRRKRRRRHGVHRRDGRDTPCAALPTIF